MHQLKKEFYFKLRVCKEVESMVLERIECQKHMTDPN